MENVKVGTYENDKHMSYKENKDIPRTDSSNLYKGFKESAEDLLEEVLALFHGESVAIRTADIAIASKIIASHEIKYSKSYMNDKYAMKYMLNDSWTLAEGLDKEVSHTHIVRGLAYCSSYNFD